MSKIWDQIPEHILRAPVVVLTEEVEPWLNTQMANRKIAHTFGRGRVPDA